MYRRIVFDERFRQQTRRQVEGKAAGGGCAFDCVCWCDMRVCVCVFAIVFVLAIAFVLAISRPIALLQPPALTAAAADNKL